MRRRPVCNLTRHVAETVDVAFTQSLNAASRSYNERFDSTFSLPPPFNSDDHRAFAKSLTSDLLGGVGYYQGASIIDRNFRHDYDDDADDDEEDVTQGPQLTEERELLTATPSRSFFPRGFYWDEGFHLALLGEWDNDLSLEILKDWVALIDEDGWVGREQILGEESRSKVRALQCPWLIPVGARRVLDPIPFIRQPTNIIDGSHVVHS